VANDETRQLEPASVLVYWMGTTGDALPFLGIADAIARRGHQVKVFGNGHFRPLAEKLGLTFFDLITEEQYQQRLKERENALDLESLKLNSKYVVEDLPSVHQSILEHHLTGRTLVVAQSYLLGSRIAQEELGFPMATVHLYPMLIRSVRTAPWFVPRALVRLGYRLVDSIIDAAVAGPVNQLRNQRGLPPVARVMNEWWNSPDLVLAGFPSWFAPPQEDWPASIRQVGYPEFNPQHGTTLSEQTAHFLTQGTPPLVFAHTPAVKMLDRFVEHSLGAARKLGERALFLGIDPPPIASSDVHFSLTEPHEALLPRVKGLTHHGGLGTAIAAIRAGIPQIIVPQMLDQPFNAQTLAKLGVSRTIQWKKYRDPEIEKNWRRLLNDSKTLAACQRYRDRLIHSPNACERAADEIDELIAKRINHDTRIA
jgi:rhamnosyltransferase subunit B